MVAWWGRSSSDRLKSIEIRTRKTPVRPKFAAAGWERRLCAQDAPSGDSERWDGAPGEPGALPPPTAQGFQAAGQRRKPGLWPLALQGAQRPQPRPLAACAGTRPPTRA